MNRNWIRYSVIAFVFFASLLIFSIVLNQGNTDMTMEMAPACLPTASILIEDQKVNEMHGYVQRMDAATIRDSISPIGEDRKISFQIDLYGQELKELRYEVRSVDGGRLIEDTRVTDYAKDKDVVTASASIKDLIEKNVEYNFILIATLKDGRDIFFYTRMIQCDNTLTLTKLNYVLDFHQKTFDKETAKEIAMYLEPSSEGDNSNFGKVDIHSNLSQVSWGNMKVKEIGEPMVTISELSQNLASVRLDYIAEVTEGKVTNRYRLSEFYRVRYTTDRFYLLNFNRTMEEIFTMEKASFANNKIVLGIQKEDVQLVESEGGNILAFVNAGRIYCYDVVENKLSQLFAFFDQENFDERTYYDGADIKILEVEETGNVAFIVYGYMNRGNHEGVVGVEFYYYNHLQNTIEEQIFIRYDKSPQILMADINKLSYTNRRGELFALIDGSIYKVNAQMKTCEVVAEGLGEENFFVSKTNEMIVWQESMDSAGTKKLMLMNLNTEETSEITAASGEYCKAIGFMNEDVVYGVANKDDISVDRYGSSVFPMKKVIIQAQNGSILKEYKNEDIFILDGQIRDNQLNLTRAKGTRQEIKDKETGNMTYGPLNLTPIADDQITSNVEENKGDNKVDTVITELYETIWQIELKKEVGIKRLKFLTPKEVMYEGGREIVLDEESKADRYLVYTKGRLMDIYSDPGEAVLFAYENAGTVMDCYGNEIYRRGELVTRNQIMAIKENQVTDEKDSLAVCLDTILHFEGISRNTEFMLQQGQNAVEILENNLKSHVILNLRGCPMDAMLYYVNQDIPVLALKDGGESVLIIGFNQQNVVLMDPKTGKIYKKGMNDSRQMFEENGNCFVTYARVEQTK